MRYHGDRWVTDDFCCHRHDIDIKKRCFCAVSGKRIRDASIYTSKKYRSSFYS